jgi:hypothetical protein
MRHFLGKIPKSQITSSFLRQLYGTVQYVNLFYFCLFFVWMSAYFVLTFLGFCFILILDAKSAFVPSFVLRVRLPNGSIKRSTMHNNATFSDLFGVINDTRGVFIKGLVPNVTSVSIFGTRVSLVDLKTNFSALAQHGISNSTILDLYSEGSQSAPLNSTKRGFPKRPMSRVSPGRRSPRKASSESTFPKEISLKNTKGANKITTFLGNSSFPILNELLHNSMNFNESNSLPGLAVLLGMYRNPSLSREGGSAVDVNVHAVLDLGSQVFLDVNPQRSHMQLSELSLTIVNRASRIARLLGLRVVGCAVTAPSTRTCSGGGMSSTWSAVHVHYSLQLQDALYMDRNSHDMLNHHKGHPAKLGSVAESSFVPEDENPFVVLSVTPNRASSNTSSTSSGANLEAFVLSRTALELHHQGVLPAAPLSQLSPCRLPGDGPEDVECNSSNAHRFVQLTQPVSFVVGAGSSRSNNASIDSELLAEPVSLMDVHNAQVAHRSIHKRSLNLRKKTLRLNDQNFGADLSRKTFRVFNSFQHNFPTPTKLLSSAGDQVHHEKLQKQAKNVIVKLLTRLLDAAGTVPSPGSSVLLAATLQDMLDPHLLLYLDSVMRPADFADLCGYLRPGSTLGAHGGRGGLLGEEQGEGKEGQQPVLRKLGSGIDPLARTPSSNAVPVPIPIPPNVAAALSAIKESLSFADAS